jgi:hypothetical protein
VPGSDIISTSFFDPEGEVYTAAIDLAPPYQFHSDPASNFINVVSGVVSSQLATSRVIPIVPEPATLAMLAGGLMLAARNRRRAI